MNTENDRILAAVDARSEEMVAFLRDIVRVPSVTGSEAAVQSVISGRMLDLGYDVDKWEPDAAELASHALHVGKIDSFAGRPNVVGSARATGGGKSLILNAHIDVVDSGDPGKWLHDPFAAVIDGDRLYGRGACDMKAGLAAGLFAVTAVKDAGIELRGDVHIESVISEEDGGAGTLATILRGYRADAAIITEPTRMAIVTAQGGSVVFRLHVPGRSAHGCVRDEGVSAIEKFSYLHRALLDFEDERNATITHPLYASIENKIPISVGTVRAGTWPSSVAESLVAEGRAGLVPGESLDAFCAEFAGVIQRASDADPWLRDNRPVVEWFSGQFEPAEVPADTEIATALTSAHMTSTGTLASIEAVTYGADMRHFVNFAGIPCVMYGAGDVRNAHFTDEYVPLDEVRNVARTLALAVANWCG